MTNKELGENMTNQKPITSPLKAIRQNCLDCNGNAQEVKLCPCTNCPMYPFRFGKNPYNKRKPMTEEQKEAARENLKRARELKVHNSDT